MDELAQRLGVSEATVSRWEGGKSIPKSENIRALAILMDRDPETFVERALRTIERDKLSRHILEARIDLSGEAERRVEVGEHEVVLMSDGSLVVDGHIHILPTS